MTYKTKQRIRLTYEVLSGLTVLIQFALWIGWVPGYRAKYVREDSITPLIYLFPGQKLRLKPQYEGLLDERDINQVRWNIRGENFNFSQSGLQPTVIAPAEGGVYQIDVGIKVEGERSDRLGRTSMYIVQDQPRASRVKKGDTAKLEIPSESPRSVEQPANRVLEIYAGKGNWQPYEDVKFTGDEVEFTKTDSVPTVQGKILFRLKGQGRSEAEYGTITVPPSEAIRYPSQGR
jgi:hypothetical protein